ncbi:MAG: hypothetical protein CMJ72_05975 [Planctomycetaceae bacterium]|nr:hypothetical protein [Planctomycetaceae bacterium]HCK41396.1 hypothetical protein [Planctomycetaceae bacterium]
MHVGNLPLKCPPDKAVPADAFSNLHKQSIDSADFSKEDVLQTGSVERAYQNWEHQGDELLCQPVLNRMHDIHP